MHRFRLLAALPVLAGIGLYVPAPVSAATFRPHTGIPHAGIGSAVIAQEQVVTPYYAYDIEAYGYYCAQTAPANCFVHFDQNGALTSSPDVMFGGAQAYGLSGQAAGRPAGVSFECDTNLSNYSGQASYTYERVYVAPDPSLFPPDAGFDPGTIAAGSYATLGPRYVGENTPSLNAFGQMNISAYDATTHTQATVTGINYASQFFTSSGVHEDQISRSVPNPGFTIHMVGDLYRFNPTGADFVVQHNVPVSCVAGGHITSVSNPLGYIDEAGYPVTQGAENEYELTGSD